MYEITKILHRTWGNDGGDIIYWGSICKWTARMRYMLKRGSWSRPCLLTFPFSFHASILTFAYVVYTSTLRWRMKMGIEAREKT